MSCSINSRFCPTAEDFPGDALHLVTKCGQTRAHWGRGRCEALEAHRVRTAEEADWHLVLQIKGQRADEARAGGKLVRGRTGRIGEGKYPELVPDRDESLLGGSDGGFFLGLLAAQSFISL